eukprot:SAG31_NODE_3483_length_4215_cov_2.188533_6_plen_103_part_00
MDVLPALLALGLLTASSGLSLASLAYDETARGELDELVLSWSPAPVVVRFLDDSVLRSRSSSKGGGHEVGEGMELRVNRPTKMGLIYKPTEPWEVRNNPMSP